MQNIQLVNRRFPVDTLQNKTEVLDIHLKVTIRWKMMTNIY